MAAKAQEKGMKRILVLLLILTLPLYPCIELTRIIIVNGWTLWPELRLGFVVEIAFIWLFYLGIIGLTVWRMK